MNLTLTERERHAYITGDRAALTLITAGEEEFDSSISPEHEAVIDDRNRLRAALEECVKRMEDEVDVEGAPLPDAFHNAIADASTALHLCESQYDDTAADKLRVAETTIAALQAQRDALLADLRPCREALSALRYLVAPYRTEKPAPKWAQHAIDTLKRIDAPRATTEY